MISKIYDMVWYGMKRKSQPKTLIGKLYPQKEKNSRSTKAHRYIRTVKSNIKQQGKHKLELSDLQILNLIKDPCFYCGKIVDFPHERNGIDRVNNDLNYIVDNCVPCCKYCNSAKKDKTFEEFKQWVKKLVINLKGKVFKGK